MVAAFCPLRLKYSRRRTNVMLVGLAVCVEAGSSVTAPGDALELVADGQPRSTILLEEKPTVSAQLAAYELQ